MEIILPMAVVAAVTLFGALISVGNERQRRAIDGLNQQIVLWAVQDLRIKRENLARNVHVEDPLGWLNGIASKACGCRMKLEILEVLDDLDAVVCTDKEAGTTVVFSSRSPGEIRQMGRGKRSRLSRWEEKGRIISRMRNGRAYEISVLNGGILFDLELPLAWKQLTAWDAQGMERLWVYVKITS